MSETSTSPSIVSRKVGAGIQARLAQLQGATGPAVITREVPKKFASGYDEPFRERLDGTLRRSLSGTWSSQISETQSQADNASTDGSQTLIDVQTSPSLGAELKRRRDFTKSWGKQQQAVVDHMPTPETQLTPEPSRIQLSPQPILEEPEPVDEEEIPAPTTPIQAPVQTDDPKHGILTPPASEPESPPLVRKPEAPKPQSTPVRKTEPKRLDRPHTTGRVHARPAPAPAPAPSLTPSSAPRLRTRAPSRSTLAPPPVPRLHLTPSPKSSPPRASLIPPRAHTSMSTSRKTLSSRIPDKVLPPPIRPRTQSRVYEGPTLASLAKQKPRVVSGVMSRAVSRAQ